MVPAGLRLSAGAGVLIALALGTGTAAASHIDNYTDGSSSPFGPSPVDNQQMAIYGSGNY